MAPNASEGRDQGWTEYRGLGRSWGKKALNPLYQPVQPGDCPSLLTEVWGLVSGDTGIERRWALGMSVIAEGRDEARS